MSYEKSQYPPVPPAPSSAPPPLGDKVLESRHRDAKTCIALLEWMLASRMIEERIGELYRQNRISGGCYTGIGNEATSVGTAFGLEEGDVVVPTHRDMGTHLVRGHTLLDIMRQYLKRGTSQTGGKDVGLHLGQDGSNIVGMISPLAHMMPVAVGVAIAERQLGRNSVVLTTVGDGATSLGDFHESLNFAAVLKLPILFVVVNNQYAYSTPVTIQYACEKLSDRAVGYGMAGEQIDGTDVIEVLDASSRAIERARAGLGPTLIDSVTMRMRGHSEHDDFRYVPRSLLDAWRPWDPIARFSRYLTERQGLEERELESIRGRVAESIDRAVEVAEKEPPPDPASAERDVFRVWSSEWSVPSGEECDEERPWRR